MQKRSNIEPKSLFYVSDGTGRDSYIGVNSGGICKQRPHTAYTTERKQLTFKEMKTKCTNNIIPKILHYHSDGTGRDNYIIVDEGGLTIDGRSQYKFINGLRKYNHNTTNNNGYDYFNIAQRTLPKIDSDKNKKKRSSQYNSALRLSQPRIYPDPYEGVFYRPKTPSMIRMENLSKSRNFY